jgi:8-oxo-dGTP diphosphatase
MPYTYNYPRPALTVDAVVFRKDGQDLKVALIQRKDPPFKKMWALPGGFVDIDETLAQAVHRELLEETGLKCIHLKQLHTFGAIGRDPRGRTVSVVYYGYVNHDQKLKAGDDAKKAGWFSVHKLPELAFDHQEILELAISRIGISSNPETENTILGP